MDKGTITFFDIKEIGFYTKSTEGEAEKVTGSLLETVGKLAEWVLQCNGIKATIPWDVDKYANRIPIYTKDVYTDPSTNDTLFVFWAGDEDQENSRRGIKANAMIGSYQNDSVNLKDAVPLGETLVGHAMYYWFIPSHNLLATIDFRHSRLKSSDVFEYIKRCVRFKIDLSGTNNDLIKVSEKVEAAPNPYTKTFYKCSKTGNTLFFRFNAGVKSFTASSVSLKKLAKSITHVVVRDRVSYIPEDSMQPEMKMLGAFFNAFKDKEDQTERQPIEFVDKRSVSEKELKALIEDSEKNLDENDDWIGVGFQAGVNDKPKFFKSFVHRPNVMMDPKYSMGNYYNAEPFLKELISQRDSLILTTPVSNGQFNSDNDEEIGCEKSTY
jgi:hypothetical protein